MVIDVSDECTIDEIGGIVGDSTARTILVETRTHPHSAESLSQTSEVSKPTIYRRIEDLRGCDLVIEETAIDPEAGHHHTQYRTNVDRIILNVEEDGLTYELERDESMANRFTRLVEEM